MHCHFRQYWLLLVYDSIGWCNGSVLGRWCMGYVPVCCGCCYPLFYIAGFFIMWIRYHRSLNLEAIAKVSTGKCAMIRCYGFDRKRDNLPNVFNSHGTDRLGRDSVTWYSVDDGSYVC